MKTAILDGARDGDPLLAQTRQILVAELERRGWQVDVLPLCHMDIHHCLGCFGCWIQTPGQCLIDDAGRDVARAVIHSDMVVYLSPVTFGGYAAELKKALDRSICLVSPFFTKIDGEVHHRPRYARYPRLLGVGVLPQHDAESERVFATLVARNALNMHAPDHATGVFAGSDGPQTIQAGIQRLLQEVEGGS
jgi:hypothetical protein